MLLDFILNFVKNKIIIVTIMGRLPWPQSSSFRSLGLQTGLQFQKSLFLSTVMVPCGSDGFVWLVAPSGTSFLFLFDAVFLVLVTGIISLSGLLFLNQRLFSLALICAFLGLKLNFRWNLFLFYV